MYQYNRAGTSNVSFIERLFSLWLKCTSIIDKRISKCVLYTEVFLLWFYCTLRGWEMSYKQWQASGKAGAPAPESLGS